MTGPSEQAFCCQSCRCRLNITDLDTLDQAGPSGKQSVLMNGSLFGGTKVDESFVLLDASKRGQAAQDPHQPHPGKLCLLVIVRPSYS